MKRIIRSVEELKEEALQKGEPIEPPLPPSDPVQWRGYPSRAVVEEVTDAAEEYDFDADYTICWRFPEDSPLIRKYDLKPIPGEEDWYYSPDIKYEHICD